MIKNIAIAFCALMLLSGCGSTKKGMSSTTELVLNERFTREAGDRVFFPFNSSEITADSKAVLCKQAEWLKAHPSLKATIEGHCDERGTREYNLALGERRANAAKKLLVTYGVEESRLETISYGKERPAVIGNTDADYALNRRDVTVVRD
ncbi:MAG: peptidoglycan-associated lipoprotein Pal [Pseudomonadota bacterium]